MAAVGRPYSRLFVLISLAVVYYRQTRSLQLLRDRFIHDYDLYTPRQHAGSSTHAEPQTRCTQLLKTTYPLGTLLMRSRLTPQAARRTW